MFISKILKPIKFYNHQRQKKVNSIKKKRTPKAKNKIKSKKINSVNSLKKIDLQDKIRKFTLLCRRKSFGEKSENKSKEPCKRKERVINMKLNKVKKPRKERKKKLKDDKNCNLIKSI